MALIAQLQTVWRAQLEKYLLVEPVFAATLTNKNYEGDLKTNKTLKIISVGRVSTQAYTTPSGWTWQKLATTNQTFEADQSEDVHILVEPIEQMGSAINILDEAARESALALRLSQDSYLASLHTQITGNVYGDNTTPIVVGFGTGEVLPSVALTKLHELAATANANMTQFNTVVPVWLASYLNQELGTRYTAVGDSALGAGVTPGVPITAAVGGFSKIVPSNNVYNTSGAKYKVMAGTPSSSITFAEALTVAETGKLIEGYGDFIKSLQIYGAKIPFPGHMSLGTFNRGTPRTA